MTREAAAGLGAISCEIVDYMDSILVYRDADCSITGPMQRSEFNLIFKAFPLHHVFSMHEAASSSVGGMELHPRCVFTGEAEVLPENAQRQ